MFLYDEWCNCLHKRPKYTLYWAINTRCQCCITISSLPFLIKANAEVTPFFFFFFSHRCWVCREQSLQCLLQILHHYNAMHLSSSPMQPSLSTICGNLCNLKSISGFYSPALPHCCFSFQLGERQTVVYMHKKNIYIFSVCLRQCITIINLWALHSKAQYFRPMVKEWEAHWSTLFILIGWFFICLSAVHACAMILTKVLNWWCRMWHF